MSVNNKDNGIESLNAKNSELQELDDNELKKVFGGMSIDEKCDWLAKELHGEDQSKIDLLLNRLRNGHYTHINESLKYFSPINREKIVFIISRK